MIGGDDGRVDGGLIVALSPSNGERECFSGSFGVKAESLRAVFDHSFHILVCGGRFRNVPGANPLEATVKNSCFGLRARGHLAQSEVLIRAALKSAGVGF